jgi:hypothetical protein
LPSDEPRLKQIELATAIHLALHQLELRDLAFSLGVGPGGVDGGVDSGTISRESASKGCKQTGSRPFVPGLQGGDLLLADHAVEGFHSLSRFDQRRRRRFDRGYGHGFRARQVVSRYGQQSRDRAG